MAMPQERLQAFLDNQRQIMEIKAGRFGIDSEGAANWALRKIKTLKQEKEANEKLAREEIEKINQWLKQENEVIDNSIAHFEALLREYALKIELDKRKDKRSIKLPHGTIGFRKPQPKWNYDEEKAVKALERAGLNELLNVKVTPKKSDIKKRLEVVNGKVINPETGEVIEGITVEEQPDTFSVRVDE